MGISMRSLPSSFPSVVKMAQVAIQEAKKVLRRELKKRIAGMSVELKVKESKSIVNKVRRVHLTIMHGNLSLIWSIILAIVTFRGLTLHRKKTSEKLFECTRKNDE